MSKFFFSLLLFMLVSTSCSLESFGNGQEVIVNTEMEKEISRGEPEAIDFVATRWLKIKLTAGVSNALKASLSANPAYVLQFINNPIPIDIICGLPDNTSYELMLVSINERIDALGSIQIRLVLSNQKELMPLNLQECLGYLVDSENNLGKK